MTIRGRKAAAALKLTVTGYNVAMSLGAIRGRKAAAALKPSRVLGRPISAGVYPRPKSRGRIEAMFRDLVTT